MPMDVDMANAGLAAFWGTQAWNLRGCGRRWPRVETEIKIEIEINRFCSPPLLSCPLHIFSLRRAGELGKLYVYIWKTRLAEDGNRGRARREGLRREVRSSFGFRIPTYSIK